MVTPLTANGRFLSRSKLLARAIIVASALVAATNAYAAPPKIRTDAANAVPRCVSPKRLMAFIKTRNPNLDPRYADIASFYKKHGETWRVRWDYAFFQMALETNFLTYRKGDGGWGDVNPKQNNFAGLGTTGGGVPGDSYPNVSTGVLAQIQHLVVYSGERIEDPVGARTKLKQDDILVTMASKRGNTTFADLARRWAADRHYGASIEWVANNFRQNFCTGPAPVEEAEAAPAKPQKRTASASKQEPARAANLGGPSPAATQADAASDAPVRTIWSANKAASGAAQSGEASTSANTQPAARKARVAPTPERKPVIETAAAPDPVISEQIIQTGEDPAPVVEPASDAPAPLAEATPPTEPTQASAEPATTRPAAFAYAAALGAALPKARPAAKNEETCSVTSASYGGKKVLLVRSGDGAPEHFTVLTVLEGFEKSMLDSYLKAHAPKGSSLGEFASRTAAFAKAREFCPASTKAAAASAG